MMQNDNFLFKNGRLFCNSRPSADGGGALNAFYYIIIWFFALTMMNSVFKMICRIFIKIGGSCVKKKFYYNGPFV